MTNQYRKTAAGGKIPLETTPPVSIGIILDVQVQLLQHRINSVTLHNPQPNPQVFPHNQSVESIGNDKAEGEFLMGVSN